MREYLWIIVFSAILVLLVVARIKTEFKIGDEKYLKIYRRMSNFHLLLYVLLILLSILSLCKLL